MSSQNDMQTPKNWRFALKKTFLRVRRAGFAQDLKEKRIELSALGALLALFAIVWAVDSLHAAFCTLWGSIWGIIVYIVALDWIENRDRCKVVYGEAGSSSSVHDFSGEGYSGKLMIVPEGGYREDTGRKHFLEQVLEEMMGEVGVDRARSTYETFKKAAEDPYDDTGWDEPWAEALASSFEHAVEVVEERERGDR